jgi:predicted transcriptional regulator
MNNETLTTDEYDALEHIRRGASHDRVNACIGRNAKKLAGIKLIQYGRDGKVALTDKGQQLLFVRRCIEALRTLAGEPGAPVEPDVIHFLSRKSHIATRAEGGFEVTDKGHASLADIAFQDQRK